MDDIVLYDLLEQVSKELWRRYGTRGNEIHLVVDETRGRVMDANDNEPIEVSHA